MKAPLYNKLVAYSQSMLSFHMPGHKFGNIDFLNEVNLWKLDNTEAEGLDNLYHAEGIIKEAMDLMAEFYKSEQTVFITNGSTGGILASILALCKPGDQLIIARNMHHSVWSGLILAGITPIYIDPSYIEEIDVFGAVEQRSISEALEAYPNAKGVLIVSPTYEGIVSDIREIANIVHEKDKVLIVDEAHGAHFVLDEAFPSSAVQEGADIVINSMHKTLPTLTQSALLHMGSHRIEYNKIMESLRLIQTSSPSYLFMGVMDYVRAYMEQSKSEIRINYIEPLIQTRDYLRTHLNALHLFDRATACYDISKIIISTKWTHINGYKLADILSKKYHIAIEAALENYIIIMTTMADNLATLERLKEVLLAIDETLEYQSAQGYNNPLQVRNIRLGVSPREAFYADKEWISLEEADTRYAAQNIMLYPPGIPIICIGEEIDRENIIKLVQLQDRLQGIRQIEGHIEVQVLK